MEAQDTRDLQTINVTAITNPFGVGNVHFEYDLGITLQEILEKSCPDLLRYKPIVFINDHKINPEYYNQVRPKAGAVISIRLAPMGGGGGGGGGKNPLKTVLSIALVALAPAASAALLGGVLFPTAAIGLAAGGLLTGAITFAGNLLINSLIPPATPRAPSLRPNSFASGGREDVSQTYFIQGARNNLTPFATVPELLGTHRMTPPLAAQNFTETSGGVIYSRQMFLLTNGKISVSEEKLGDTLLSEFEGVTEENFFDGNSTDQSSIVPDIVTQNNINVALPYTQTTFQSRTTAENTDEVEIDLAFNQGLVYFQSDGTKRSQKATFEIRYRESPSGSWQTQSFSETRGTTAAFIISKRFTLPRGQYDFEVRNATQANPSFDGTDANARDQSRLRDEITWVAIKSYKNENPVNAENVSLKALRIKGTGQLNGAVDDYNFVGSRKIKDWNGVVWDSDKETSNPASIFYHILTSEDAKTPIADSRIDLTAIQNWHDYCAQKGFTYDAYVDYDADREELLKEVAAAGLASPVIIDNKYSVIVDNRRETIVQHISQRNSFNFSYEKTFKEQPHALRVPFINKDKGYLQDEIIVYDDGFDSSNATRFDIIDFPGVTSADNIYKLARHRIAETRLRPDMFKVSMDIENIVFTKGDRVKFSHDIALIGLKTGRVKSVTTDSGNVTAVTVDEEIVMEAGKNYSAEFWLTTGESLTVGITTEAGATNVIEFSSPITVASAPDAGDLFSFGETDSVTIDALVHSIAPQPDFLADIRLVNYDEGIYTASEGVIPAYDNNITIPPEFNKPSKPVLITIQSDENVQIKNIDGSISSRMVITLQNNNAYSVQPIVFIRQTGTDDYELANTVQADDTRVVIEGLVQGEFYDIRINYRRVGGSELGSNSISLPLDINGTEFIGEGNAPPDVENFDITVRGETAYLTWDAVNVVDLSNYEIRYSAVTSGATWGSSIPLDVAIPQSSTSASFPNAIGTFLIKAKDRLGNYSENATLTITTVGKLLGLNLITTINEHSTWGGTLEGTAVNGGSLELGGTDNIDDWTLIDDIEFWDYGEGAIASGGLYTFEDIQDLGAVYDCVLNANITVSGSAIFDEVDEWSDVDSRASWDGTDASQYSVVLQVSTTQDNPLSSPTWTDWKPLKPLGEYTARAFRYRFVLSSFVSDITPSISFAQITIDMPDRVESDDDISSGTGGYSVTFTEGFRIAPVIEITADNMATGDYYTITSKTATGFSIEFFNSSGTSVDRTFSWVAQGYGRTV